PRPQLLLPTLMRLLTQWYSRAFLRLIGRNQHKLMSRQFHSTLQTAHPYLLNPYAQHAHVLFVLSSLLQSQIDRKSTRLNSSHVSISYAVFRLTKKDKHTY